MSYSSDFDRYLNKMSGGFPPDYTCCKAIVLLYEAHMLDMKKADRKVEYALDAINQFRKRKKLRIMPAAETYHA